MPRFGGSCFVSGKTQHSPGISRNLRQGLISWNSLVSLCVCLCLGERENLCLACCLRMYLWFHQSRISSYQLVPTGKEFVTSYTPNMRFKDPNIYEKNLKFLLSSSSSSSLSFSISFSLCFSPCHSLVLGVFLFVMDHFSLVLCLLSARPRPTYGVSVVASFSVEKQKK